MKERVIEAGREVMRACIDAGGTLTGEHGIGVEKQMGLHRAGHGCDEAAGGRPSAPMRASTPARSFLTRLSRIGSRNYISPCPKPLGSMSSARMERQIGISPGEKHEQL